MKDFLDAAATVYALGWTVVVIALLIAWISMVV